MTMTPLDIQHKEFDVKLKGYDKNQVNDFLDVIKKDFEQLIRDQKEMEKHLTFAEEKIGHFQNLQDTLNKSIVVAQDAADRLRENAHKEAEIILFEAEKSADQLLKDAADKANQINQETESIRRESRNFRQKLHLMVESQMNLVQNEEWDQLLNTSPVQKVETPTLDDVLMNRSRKVEDLIKKTEPTVFKDEEEKNDGHVEAIEISL